MMVGEFLGTPVWLWLAFLGIVAFVLALDLGLLHRDDHVIHARESLLLSAGYLTVGLSFGAYVWWYLGAASGMEYLTGFLIEKTLAMDNVFVIATIFTFFAVPPRYQHRVLFWGILGVIVLRALMIGLGTAVISRFDWVLYLFGAFLIFTGVKMLVLAREEIVLERNPVVRWLRAHLRVTDRPFGNRFWVKLPAPEYDGGPPSGSPSAPLVWWATPLFLALALIEVVDIIFAVDSVPAIFAVTQNPFIVYTSNIFAVLGLRALYFAIADLIGRFHYLSHALALVLVFIGGKLVATDLVGKVPAWLSLGVTLALLAGGVLLSLLKPPGTASRGAREPC